jgi:hypothetical protein
VFDEETQTWGNLTTQYGPESQLFGGGPSDPNDPGSKLDTPNGTPLISFGAPNAQLGVFLEIKYIALTKINPGPIAARIDANSGMTFRFGSGFTRSQTDTPIDIPGDPFGLGYLPAATDQISRFDENGMTNLILNMRTPDNMGETHRVVMRNSPGPNDFDGTTATVNVRAKLLAGNTVPNIVIVAKDLDGNDTAANPFGADEYTYTLDLSQFNTSTLETISIPLQDFILSTHVPTTSTEMEEGRGSGPFGFLNPGDGEMTDFNLYEFALLVPPDTGLLKLELEYMEIRLPVLGLPGDYNDDGIVDAADYTTWRDHLGNPDESALNGNGDGLNGVDAGDYTLWVNNFGNHSGSGSSALSGNQAVPEPGTWILGLIALGLVSWFRREYGYSLLNNRMTVGGSSSRP